MWKLPVLSRIELIVATRRELIRLQAPSEGVEGIADLTASRVKRREFLLALGALQLEPAYCIIAHAHHVDLVFAARQGGICAHEWLLNHRRDRYVAFCHSGSVWHLRELEQSERSAVFG